MNGQHARDLPGISEQNARRRVLMVRDRVDDLMKAMDSLTTQQVLVGIPEATTTRSGEGDARLTNALIGYLMETGSPAHNLPARPWLVPGVMASVNAWSPYLKLALSAALQGKPDAVRRFLEMAGIAAVSAVKRRIRSNIPPPLSPATVRARHLERHTRSLRFVEKKYIGLVKLGVEPAQAQAAAGLVALINSGQLLNSVTYAVRDTADEHDGAARRH